MKIAITGSQGFIGKHLIKELRLEQGKEISVFDHKKHDLLSEKKLKSLVIDKDIIIHLAGVNRLASDEEIIKVNVLGTTALLSAITNYNPKARIIFLSSFQVYHEGDMFGVSKRLAEEVIEYYTRNYKIQATILRCTNVYGPGAKPFLNSVIATFVYKIKNREKISINGDGSSKRDYLYVDDVVSAIIKSIFYSQKARIEYFDICNGKMTSLIELIKLLEKISGQKVVVTYNKAAHLDNWNFKKNFSKASSHLQWKPLITLEEGLKKMIEFY